MKLKPMHIYKDKYDHLRLILGVSDIGANYVYLYRTNIYEEIRNITIDIATGDYSVCIDRVSYMYLTDATRYGLEELEVLDKRDYQSIVQTIAQYFIGEIICDEERFIYKDMVKPKKITKPKTVVYNKNTSNDTVKSDEEIINQDPIKVKEALEESREVAEVIKFSFNGSEWVEGDDDEYNKYLHNILATNPPPNLTDVLDKAKKYNIRFSIDYSGRFGKWGEYVFNLTSSTISPVTVVGEASKPRKNSRDSASNIKNLNLLYSYSEVVIISNMNSPSQVMDRYNLGKSEASVVLKNAKRIMGYNIPPDKNIKYNYTCHFNNGMTIDDVYELYDHEIPKHIIKNNYEIWGLNGNGYNNEFVMEKWQEILNSGDVDILIEAYFDNNNKSFSDTERCSYTLGNDIMSKIYHILCKNPFVPAGFGAISFDDDALLNYASDAINGTGIANEILGNLYEMTRALYDVYVETYDDHAMILTDDKYLPESIKHDSILVDCYKSLLWNRYNHNYMTARRKLSQNQIDAIESKDTKRIALLFMVKHSSVQSIRKTYNQIKNRSNK